MEILIEAKGKPLKKPKGDKMSLLEKIKNLFNDREAIARANLSNKEVETAREKLISGMFITRPRLDPAKLQWFSDEQKIDLTIAHTNTQIWNRGGRGIFVTFFNGDPDNTRIRFGGLASALYPIRLGYVKGAFDNIYLTNTAQTDRTLKFVIGYRNFAEYKMLASDKATEPHFYVVAMETGNTEYSQALPAHTKKFLIHLEDASAFKVAFVTGKVAGAGDQPILTVPASGDYGESNVDLTDKTLYFASTVATKKAEIIAWT